MLKDYRLLLILTLVSVAALIGSVARGLRPDYVTWQTAYYDLTEQTEATVGIKQINVETAAGQLIDRCTTCHLGVANADAAEYPAPLATHPVIVPGADTDPHNLNHIGCVVCHEGNGRAVDASDAHGHFHDWPAPLLTGAHAQANCVQCHDTVGHDLPGAELFNRGKRLFIERACFACHTIQGVSSGKSAPDLTDAGGRFDLHYLIESIVDPKANTPVSKMPYFDWITNTADVEALAVYLKGQRGDRLRDPDATPLGITAGRPRFATIETPSVDAGRRVLTGLSAGDLPLKGGCLNCHSYREADGTLRGGTNGPDLTMTYRARGADFIRAHVQNPRGDVMDSPMPPFANILSDAALESVVRFLGSLTYRLDAGDPPNGQRLYETYCLSCHGEKLDGRGTLAKILDPLPRDLSKHRFVAAYHDRLAQSIRKGVPGTDMPPWGDVLQEAEVQALLDYVVGHAGDAAETYQRPAVRLPRPGDPERRAWGEPKPLVAGDATRGETAFQKFCVSCHGKLANGKGPEAYALEHPLPRNLISKPFMNQSGLTDQRLYKSILLGVPGTPMPPHDHLQDQTILDLIAYLRANTETGR